MEKKGLTPLVIPPVSTGHKMAPAGSGPIRKELYKSKSSKAIGIIQIVGGIFLFLFCLGTAVPRREEPMMMRLGATGFFGMIGLLISGGLSICASKKKTPCLIITHMVFCILLTFTLFEIFSYSIMAMVMNTHGMGRAEGMEGYGYMGGAMHGRHGDAKDMDWGDEDKREWMRRMMDGKMREGKRDKRDATREEKTDDKDGDGKRGDKMGGKREDKMDGKREDWMKKRQMMRMWHEKKRGHGPQDESEPEEFHSYKSRKGACKVSLGCAVMVFILSLMEFIVSICGSALACKVTCCEKRGNPVSPTFVYQQPHVVELGGNPDVRSKAAISKEQEALGNPRELDARELATTSPPPAYEN